MLISVKRLSCCISCFTPLLCRQASTIRQLRHAQRLLSVVYGCPGAFQNCTMATSFWYDFRSTDCGWCNLSSTTLWSPAARTYFGRASPAPHFANLFSSTLIQITPLNRFDAKMAQKTRSYVRNCLWLWRRPTANATHVEGSKIAKPPILGLTMGISSQTRKKHKMAFWTIRDRWIIPTGSATSGGSLRKIFLTW